MPSFISVWPSLIILTFLFRGLPQNAWLLMNDSEEAYWKNSTLHVTFTTKPLTKTVIHTSGTAPVTFYLGLLWSCSLNPKVSIFYRSSPWGWNASKLQTLKHSIQWCEQPDSVKGKYSINLFPQWFKQNMVTKCIQTLIWQSAHGSKDWVQWKRWCNKYTVHLFACPITQILYIYIYIKQILKK